MANGKYLDHHHKSIITSTSTETYWLWYVPLHSIHCLHSRCMQTLLFELVFRQEISEIKLKLTQWVTNLLNLGFKLLLTVGGVFPKLQVLGGVKVHVTSCALRHSVDT